MTKKLRKFAAAGALAVAGLTMSTTAYAATVLASTFDTGDEGWRVGEFTSAAGDIPFDPVYNAAAQNITTSDQAGYNAFIAPSAWLGNRAAAFGGTIRFDLADTLNNSAFTTPYSPLTLIGGFTTLYAVPSVFPSTNPSALSTYIVTLTGANFRTADQGGGAAVTDAQLLAVLGSLDRIGINADWNSGDDLVTLDNVALCDAGGCDAVAAVPEPSTWAMMLAGFGLIGGVMRRRESPVRLRLTF